VGQAGRLSRRGFCMCVSEPSQQLAPLDKPESPERRHRRARLVRSKTTRSACHPARPHFATLAQFSATVRGGLFFLLADFFFQPLNVTAAQRFDFAAEFKIPANHVVTENAVAVHDSQFLAGPFHHVVRL